MKNLILFLVLIVLTSCNKNSKAILDASTPLKNAPKDFFEVSHKHTYNLKIVDSTYTFSNKYKRHPNTEFSKFYLKKHTDTYIPYFNVTVNLSKDKKITIKGTEFYKNEVLDSLKDFIDFAAEGKPTLIHLNFDENLTINDYVEFINLIEPIVSSNISINENVFIYNVDLLPDCDCAL